jgi:butyryl-CoA dehydrogenase
MASQYFSLPNLKFILHQQLKASELSQYPYFEHLDKEAFDMVLDAAVQLGDQVLFPYYQDADRKQPLLQDGKVSVHPQVKTYIRAMAQAGFIGATAPFEEGGQQLPEVLNSAIGFILGAANNGLTSYTGLTNGAANLIITFGTDALKKAYVARMLAGEWQGTMALTEPQAGSSLSDITSSAEPTEQGHYLMRGQKIFISAGDHDQVENTVHLMLARIKGAPAGTKGISLFVIPQKRFDQKGVLIDNDVVSAGMYHKMGQKATPALHLICGDRNNCYGYLVGEPNKGLPYMFQMMNEARIGVGLTGVSIASAAYYASLEYARERPQSRRLNNRDLNTPQIPIIHHPDVKRMLLYQKSVVEGSLALLLECAWYGDMAKVSEGPKKEKYKLLLDLLTPVAKTYPTEAGIQSVSQGLQCLGGYGYCEDFPLEQLYRDIRITSIYEGTTGIQSLDLLGRKITMHHGKALQYFMEEITQAIEEADKLDALKLYALMLSKEVERLSRVTKHMLEIGSTGDAERFLSDATLYLEFFSLVTLAWQWLKQGTTASQTLISENIQGEELTFHESKVHTMKYFFHYELPKTAGLATRLLDTVTLTLASEKEMLA